MQPELLTFRSFDDPGLVEELVDFLKLHDIPYVVDGIDTRTNPYTGNLTAENAVVYEVKIPRAEFGRANELLLKYQEDHLQVDDTHYLYQFTDDELKDVVVKTNEWSEADQIIARRILKERGLAVDDETIEQLKQAHLTDLQQTEKPQTLIIIAGYLLAFFWGFGGIFIGWYLKSNHIILPNGDRVYKFRAEDRLHGKIIFILGIISLVVGILGKAAFWIFHMHVPQFFQ